MTGTFINVGTVLAGALAGTLLGSRLPDRVRETVIHCLGLLTLLLGVAEGLAAFRPPLTEVTRGAVLIVLGSLLVGGVAGELLGIERWLDRAGEALKADFCRSTLVRGREKCCRGDAPRYLRGYVDPLGPQRFRAR